MQYVRYIDPRGNITVVHTTPPFLFHKITGIGAIDAQSITTEAAGIDGRAFHGLYFSDREIKLYIHIKGTTRQELYANRERAIKTFSASPAKQGTLGRLEYYNDNGGWWIPVSVKRGPDPNARGGNYFIDVDVLFYAPSPFWRSITLQQQPMAYMDGGFEFPLVLDAHGEIVEVESGLEFLLDEEMEPIGVEFGTQGCETELINAGDVPAPIEITISGPALAPMITKRTTGEYILVDRILAEGDELYINTTPGNIAVTITRADGTTEPAIGYLDLSSTLFLLDPGTNEIEYASADASRPTEVQVRTYSQYGGV